MNRHHGLLAQRKQSARLGFSLRNKDLSLLGNPFPFPLCAYPFAEAKTGVSVPNLVKDESFDQLLVPCMKKMPIKMYRSLKHNKDFEVSLSYDPSDGMLPPGVTYHTFAIYSVSDLKDATDN